MSDSCVVDSGATKANICLQVKTKGQKIGPAHTVVVGLDRDQLLQAVGVKTADLLNIKKITCRPLEFSDPTNATFGITLGHSAVVGQPDSINTNSRSITHDNETGVASAYHYVHTTGAAFGDHVVDVDEVAHSDPEMPFKTALRWRTDVLDTSGPFNLMNAENVNCGVIKTEANGAAKYLITPEDANGPSAMWRLLEHNKNTNFCNGRYKDGKRTEVTYEGKPAVVMTEADFDTLGSQLRESLATTSKFNNGLYAHCMLVNGNAPDYITVPLVIEREPRTIEGHEKSTITLSDLSEHLSGTGISAAKKTPLTKTVHPDAPEGTVATFTPLSQIDESN